MVASSIPTVMFFASLFEFMLFPDEKAQVNLEIVSVCALGAVSCAAEKDSVFLRKNPVETLDDSHFI